MIRKVWRSLTKPVFYVIMDKENTTVTAGENTQICTITIYLHADRKVGKHQAEINFPRLIIDEIPGVDKIFRHQIQHRREVLEIGVYVHATACGTYCINPRFLTKYNFKVNNITPVDFEVTPAKLNCLELYEIGPDRGQREICRDSIYRGCRAEIWIKAKDKFGNPATVDGEFELSRESTDCVTVLSTAPCPYMSFGNYLVTLLCNKVGTFSFDLQLPNNDLKLQVNDLEILLPPVSPTNSYVVPTKDVKTSQDSLVNKISGESIELTLMLYDIFGNETSFEESKGFLDGIRLVCCDETTSSHWYFPYVFSTSLKVCPDESNTNACVVKFTPLIKGKRLFSLQVGRKAIKNSSIEINVQPGPLHEVQIVNKDPFSLSIYRSRTAKIGVAVKDEFGNQITGSDVSFKVLSKDSFVKLLSVTEEGSYVVTVLGDKTGKTSFDLVVSQGNRKVVKNIPMEINTPPVSESLSYFLKSDIHKIQKRVHQAGNGIELTFMLYDIFENSIAVEESIDFLARLRLVGCCQDYLPTSSDVSNLTPIKDCMKREDESLKVCPVKSNSNACVVNFTPLIKGRRLFSLKVGRKEIKNSSIKINVQPGPLHEVQILSQEPSSLSIYRSRTAKIWVNVKDEFGNQLAESDARFEVLSKGSFVKLMSVTYDSEKGSYVVIVRGEKSGKTSFDLVVSQGNREVVKCISMEIITPPVSGSNSNVLKVDKKQNRNLTAGETMQLTLMLHDIFGNKISFEESKGFLSRLRLACRDDRQTTCSCSVNPQENSTSTPSKESRKEENSLKVNPFGLNTNACVVKFTPLIAGKRLFSLNAASEEIKNSSTKITVQPAPVHELHIVNQEPSSLSIYRSQTAKIWVNVKDEFGNQVIGSDVSFKVLSKGSFVKLLSATYGYSEKGSYVIMVRGEKSGKSLFDLIVSQGNHEVVKGIPMEIISPPVSHANSYIPQNDIETLQKTIHKSGKPITFQLKLIDIFGNPISFEERGSFPQNVRLVHYYDVPPGWSCSDGNNREERNPLIVRPSELDSTACELVFTPKRAGKRAFFLEIEGKTINNSTMKLAILPLEGQQVEIDPQTCPVCGTSEDKVRTVSFRKDSYLEFYEYHRNILCKGVARRDLVGADKTNIRNINRALEKEYPDCELSNDMISRSYGRLVLFDLSTFPEGAALKVLEVVSLLVESEHCRDQANEMGDQRQKWQQEEDEATLDKNYKQAIKFRKLKFECGSLMNENNEKASDSIFKFYNYGRPQSEIDLHGQRVANPKSLKELKAKLRRENTTDAQIEEIIERQRQKRDEAIRKLDARITTFDHERAKQDGEDWLEIIDGAGHHSATKGQQRIRPKVQEYLRKKNIKYVEANEGALIVTFSEYIGEQPCVGNFYCKICKKGWTSISSWQGFYQRCYKCDAKGKESNCYPFKLRSTLPPKRQGGRDFTRQDHRRLCEKCIQLKMDCRRSK